MMSTVWSFAQELSKSVQEFKLNCAVKETRTSKALSEQPDQSEKARRMKEKLSRLKGLYSVHMSIDMYVYMYTYY